jgi:hypothetical protein
MYQPRKNTLLLLLLTTACGGKTAEDSADPWAEDPPCEDALELANLATVPADTWPAGLTDAIDAFAIWEGRWQGGPCGESSTVEFKLEVPNNENIEVILDGIQESGGCGCIGDPALGPDNTLDPIAKVLNASVFVSGFDDVAVDGQDLETSVTIFGSGQDILMRLCTDYNVDPALGSQYREASVMMRLAVDGTMTGAVVVSGDEETRLCELEQLTRLPD